MMNLKAVIHQLKKEKELHRQDQELRFAIMFAPKPLFQVPVLQLVLALDAQYAIDSYLF